MRIAMRAAVLVLMMPVLYLFGAATESSFPVVTGSRFGQRPPSQDAALFMDGVISTQANPQMNAALSKDGREFLFCSRHRGSWAIFSTLSPDGVWSEPTNVGPPVNTDAGENYPSVAANGNIYFFSCREGGLGAEPCRSDRWGYLGRRTRPP
ncbi:MAG: hypothetical protein GY906_03340 [bacterium]|nr:hypothetical protein [bacterium]